MKRCFLRKWSLIWPYFIFIAVAGFILWSQKSSRAFFVGYDSWFHMNQFYETAMQIKTGHFSWFMTLFSYGQVGRIVDALYGPVFSYLMGGILLLIGTWSRFQLTVSFLVLCISGMTMYHLVRFVRMRRSLSLILGLIYLSSAPVTEWVNEQTFGGIGNAILPLVILEGLKLWKRHSVNVMPLAVLLAVILQIHLMTAIIAIIALIPFGIISLIESHQKIQWVERIFGAVIIFFLLTCNVWETMLDVFYGNNVIKPFPVIAMNDPSISLSWINGNISLLNPIYIIMTISIIALLFVEWNQMDRNQKILPWLSLIFIWLSSAYFPWTMLEHRIPSLSQSFQFPDRFLGVAVILFLLTFGLGISRLNLNNNTLSFIILLGLTLIAFSSITSEENLVENNVNNWHSRRVFLSNNSNFHPQISLRKLRNAYQSKNLSLAHRDTIKSISDYLPSSQPSNAKTYRQIHPKSRAMRELFRIKIVHHPFKHQRHTKDRRLKTCLFATSIKSPIRFKKFIDGHGLIIKWNQPKRLTKHDTQIPAVRYHHTVVRVNDRKAHVTIDKIGAIHLRPKVGNNEVTLHYQASKLWNIMMIVSAISWVTLIGYLIFKLIKWDK